MAKIPKNFSGKKFSEKYNLDIEMDFVVNNGFLIAPSLPDLTEADLSDCIALEIEQEITLDDFISAFALYEDGKKSKMTELMQKHKNKKSKEIRK